MDAGNNNSLDISLHNVNEKSMQSQLRDEIKYDNNNDENRINDRRIALEKGNSNKYNLMYGRFNFLSFILVWVIFIIIQTNVTTNIAEYCSQYNIFIDLCENDTLCQWKTGIEHNSLEMLYCMDTDIKRQCCANIPVFFSVPIALLS